MWWRASIDRYERDHCCNKRTAAVDFLPKGISRNQYAPGTKLTPERDMLTEYQVGRGTLRESLVRYSPQFARTFTEKLLTYGLGRGVEYDDMPVVRSIA